MGNENSSVKGGKKKPASGRQPKTIHKPPPMFLRYRSLQDDSQSLCTGAVQNKKENKLSLIFSSFCSATNQQLLFISVCAPFAGRHAYFQESAHGCWHHGEILFLCQHHTVNTISNMFGDPFARERWHCWLQEALISKYLFLSCPGSTRKAAVTHQQPHFTVL